MRPLRTTEVGRINVHIHFSLFECLQIRIRKMAKKLRDSAYVNELVMYRNACEEKKLKFTLDQIEHLKHIYSRQKDQEKMFFAVQHMAVPVKTDPVIRNLRKGKCCVFYNPDVWNLYLLNNFLIQKTNISDNDQKIAKIPNFAMTFRCAYRRSARSFLTQC